MKFESASINANTILIRATTQKLLWRLERIVSGADAWSKGATALGVSGGGVRRPRLRGNARCGLEVWQ